MSRSTDSRPIQVEAGSFALGASDLYGRLRADLSAVVESVAGPVRGGADLQRSFGVGKTLGWRLYNLMTLRHPSAAASGRVPGADPLMKFARAAERRGADRDAARRLRESCERLAEYVRVHAGDQSTFDTMLLGLVEHEEDQVNIGMRREAYNSGVQIWGTSARVEFGAVFFAPSTIKSRCAMAAVTGKLGFRRYRTNATLEIMSRHHETGAPQTAMRNDQIRPLLPEDPTRLGILPQFSGPMPPEIEVEHLKDGTTVFALGDRIGNTAELELVWGEHVPDACWAVQVPGVDSVVVGRSVRVPTELLMIDLLVHRDAFGPIEPAGRVLSQNHSRPLPDPQRDALPIVPRVWTMGRCAGSLNCPEIPRYSEMMGTVFDQLRWDPDAFDVFRCRLEYPVNPSAVQLTFPLPER